MIIAGIGSRKGVSAVEVIAAIDAALEAHGLTLSAVSAIGIAPAKRGETGIYAAASRLGLQVLVASASALAQASQRTISLSALSQAIADTPSASEAAALAVAGEDARLAGPRLIVGPVTCAIALGGDDR